MDDLFCVVKEYKARDQDGVIPIAAQGCIVVSKQHLIQFLRRELNNAFVDLNAMRTAGLLRFGGSHPNKWLSLRCATHGVPSQPASLPDVADYNGTLNEEDALAMALKMSVSVPSKAMPMLCKTPMDPPLHLCCPITLDIFTDPVTTVRGHTYERHAIVKWFSRFKNPTDPLTGEVLSTALLLSNDAVAHEVKQYLSES